MTWMLLAIRGLLAVLFLFAGGMKLVTPADILAAQSGLSAGFLQFIGVCEVLGAFGLVLPGLFHIREELTPLAALGLVIIMIGATVMSVVQGGALMGIAPFLIGGFAALTAVSTWRLTLRVSQ